MKQSSLIVKKEFHLIKKTAPLEIKGVRGKRESVCRLFSNSLLQCVFAPSFKLSGIDYCQRWKRRPDDLPLLRNTGISVPWAKPLWQGCWQG